MLTLVFTVRLAWGWQAGRMLQQQLDTAKARGEWATAEDIKLETVPAPENAWTLQQKAMQALNPRVDSPWYSNDDYRNFPPFNSAWMKRAAASETAHVAAFDLARQSRNFSRAQIRDRLAAPLFNSIIETSLVSGSRKLACTLADGAIYCQIRGDDAEAVERIRDVLHLARSLRSDPVMISQLVATSLDAMAAETAMIVAPGLRFKPGAATRPATPAQVRTLIAELLDEQAAWRGFESCLPTERLALADYLSTRARGTWIIAPLEAMEQVRANRYLEIAIEAGRLRTEPAVKDRLARGRTEEPANNALAAYFGTKGKWNIPRYSRWFLVWPGELSRNFEIHFRGIADRRAAAVSLAAQLYRADHGAWPKNLNDLTPDDLPAIPADPFHNDGQPLGYVILNGAPASGADRPLVYYDAGPDHPTMILPEPMYNWQHPQTPHVAGQDFRQYRDLSRFAPPAPSTQAVEGDPQKPNAPRK